MRRLLSLCLILFALCISSLYAQLTVTITGTVVDAETKRPVVGALIRVLDMKLKVITDEDGEFELSLDSGAHPIRVISLGYVKLNRTISTDSTDITLSLTPGAMMLDNVPVTAMVDATIIARRAIARRQLMMDGIGDVKGLLYSKFNMKLDGSILGTPGDSERTFILETFANTWYSGGRSRAEIIQRRQTDNVPASINLVALGNAFGFYLDSMQILNTRILSPLSNQAFSRYAFQRGRDTVFEGRPAMVIIIESTVRVLPTVVGRMVVLDSTFDAVGLEVRPSESTAIPFLRNVKLRQTYQYVGGFWYPTNLYATGRIAVMPLVGLADVDGDFVATSTYTNLEFNSDIPEETFEEFAPLAATLDADTLQPTYWQNNPLSQRSNQELAIYQQVDSTVARRRASGWAVISALRPGPYFDVNRIGGYMLGLTFAPQFGPWHLDLLGAYSLGLEQPIIEGTLGLDVVNDGIRTLTLEASGFSTLAVMTSDRTYPRIINSLSTLAFGRDYYDYYLSDGGRAGVRFTKGALVLEGTMELSQQTARGIFADVPFADTAPRHNIIIGNGLYATARLSLQVGNPDDLLVPSLASLPRIATRFVVLYGKNDLGASYGAIEVKAHGLIPTISTGYHPMYLRVDVRSGTGGSTLPPQYQFRFATGMEGIGRFGTLLTAPIGLYGGTQYAQVSIDHNFSDVLWRWLGLPTFVGRGLEFTIGGSVAGSRRDDIRGYKRTEGRLYYEAGIGVSRIPTFVSNVLYLEINTRWGFGEIAHDRLRTAVTLSSPF